MSSFSTRGESKRWDRRTFWRGWRWNPNFRWFRFRLSIIRADCKQISSWGSVNLGRHLHSNTNLSNNSSCNICPVIFGLLKSGLFADYINQIIDVRYIQLCMMKRRRKQYKECDRRQVIQKKWSTDKINFAKQTTPEEEFFNNLKLRTEFLSSLKYILSVVVSISWFFVRHA
jgi:hypothetical protein